MAISGSSGKKKGHSNRHTTCGKVCKKVRSRVADGRVWIPSLPPGIRRRGEEILRERRA
jgi:hypothetical protein